MRIAHSAERCGYGLDARGATRMRCRGSSWTHSIGGPHEHTRERRQAEIRDARTVRGRSALLHAMQVPASAPGWASYSAGGWDAGAVDLWDAWERTMTLIHISHAGPDRWLLAGGKVWRFEDHPYCGPIVLTTKGGDPSENQPPERSPFWLHVNAWYRQGKRTNTVGNKTWCVYETDRQAGRTPSPVAPDRRIWRLGD